MPRVFPWRAGSSSQKAFALHATARFFGSIGDEDQRMIIKRHGFKRAPSLKGRPISEVTRLRNIAETFPPEGLNSPGLKVATLDVEIRIRCLNTIVLLVLFLASASSAEGQTTALPASKDTLSISEQIKAEWARADRQAEKASPSFREKKAEWAEEWDRASREAEKQGLLFREQKEEWDRVGREAEKHGLSFREKKAEWAAEWERVDKEAEKLGPSFREWAAEWERVDKEAEKLGPSFREWIRENKREAQSGPKKDRP